MYRKRLLTIALAALLAAGLLAGCTGTATPGGSPTAAPAENPTAAPAADTAAATQSQTAAPTEPAREMAGNMYTTGYPIVKDQESFTLLCCADADPLAMKIFDLLQQKTNVKVEWQAFPYSTAVEKKNAMYMSGEYPDALGGWLLGSSDIVTYSAQGIYIPVEEKIRKYAPNVQSAIDTFPGARETLTAPDGHIYGFAIMGPQPVSSWVMFINQAWLGKLGLAVPTTTDELTAVLTRFKTDDPNGNGKADEIPLSFYKGIYNGVFGAFGRVDTANHIVLENGKVVFTANKDEYKAAVKYLNSLYKAGLIDQEAFTQDSTQYQAKGKQDPSLYGVFFDYTGVNVVGLDKYKAEYAALAPVKGPQGTTSWIEGDQWIFRNQFAITSSAKNPDTIVRWVDALYEPEMSYQIMMGPLDIATEKGADGIYRFKTPPEGKTESDIRNETTISGLPYCITPEFNKSIEQNEFQKLKTDVDNVYAPFIIQEKFPNVWFKPEESEAIKVISTDITTYVDDMQAKWIVGQRDIDKDWDEYLKNLGNMGLDQYISVNQATVDRSLASK